ncbi:MAG TPA: prolyl oligopeptidase family serine peptidase [Vicinamibacterales bacterium]|nr:prolyl oligopeptidase family serine peptidase [Vicinamibacterales bacterium]HOQ58987.1 prolyl oligopeptidase family serine peptidase [Vicinamibacterales bacterium]HPK70431.1 prolyl oligopeptidase family serine peptidase [Vicinamibacterales bacterium]
MKPAASVAIVAMLTVGAPLPAAGLAAPQAAAQASAPAAALTPAPVAPTVDQLVSLKRAGSPAISPDGTMVAYTVREANWEEDAYETEIWIADVASGAVRQLTNGRKSSDAPAWAPDGSRLAFASTRSDKRQIWLIRPSFGEAEQLTHEREGVERFAWSPDGRQIAFTQLDPKSEAWRERDKKYGEFEIVGADHRMSHLWVIDVESKRTRRLTKGDFTVGSFDWSPDGTRIAFDHTVNADPASSGTSDISIVDVAGGAITPLVRQEGPDTRPLWSPDGSHVAFASAMARPFYYYTNSRIAVIPAAGGAITNATAGFDENASPLMWAAKGFLLFSAAQRTGAHVFLLHPSSGELRQVTAGAQQAYSGFSATRDGSAMAFIRSGPGEFPEVCVLTLSGSDSSLKKLTSLGAQAASWPQPSQEVIAWKSLDGTLIEGVLHKPADFKAGTRHPLLVVIHGGPTGVSRPVPYGSTSAYPIDIWLSRGAIVLEPNYRGSAGYGEAFRSLNVRNLGIGDAWDVLSGIDHLVAQGLADTDRVGVMGWSQGGYISAFLATHDSARFKAVSVGAGISDWMTYYVNTDIYPFTRQYLKATPWDDPKIYADTSPITYIKRASAPTLIQHGELDRRVPIPNAYELLRGLLDHGVPAKLIVYKGFGHGLTKPKAHRAAMEHNLEWFGRYIFGEAPPAQARQAARVEPFLGVLNFARIDDRFATGGAMKSEAAAELKRQGFKAVLNLRAASEPGADVEAAKAAVEAAGMKYIHIPFVRTDPAADAAVDAFLAATKDRSNQPLFFHCGGGNRAAAIWAVRRVMVDGWPRSRAVAEADSVGVISGAMRKWAEEYLSAHGRQEPEGARSRNPESWILQNSMRTPATSVRPHW